MSEAAKLESAPVCGLTKPILRTALLDVSVPFTEQELKLAREGLLKQLETGRADDASLAADFVQQLDLGRTMAFDQQLEDKLKSLSLADINATLKKYVDAKKLSVVKVGDFKKVVAPK